MKGTIYTEKEKLKKILFIGKSKYKVYICNILKFNKKKYFGFIDYNKKLIFLKKDKKINETLNHELIHAFIYEIYLKSKKNKRILKKLKSNERFIENLRFLINQNFKNKYSLK